MFVIQAQHKTVLIRKQAFALQIFIMFLQNAWLHALYPVY